MCLLTVGLFAQTIYTKENAERVDGIIVEIETKKPINGIFNGYYESGKLRNEASFKDGKKNGLTKGFYESGKLRNETSVRCSCRVEATSLPLLGRNDPATAWRRAWHHGPTDPELRDRGGPYRLQRHVGHHGGDGGAGVVLLRGPRTRARRRGLTVRRQMNWAA